MIVSFRSNQLCALNIYFFLLLLVAEVVRIKGANWAQLSGDINQNVVVPYLASPQFKHWQPRYGHVTITIPDYMGELYLFGGDTYDYSPDNAKYSAGVIDFKWGNGYKNDVWKIMKSTGADWLVQGNIRVRDTTEKHKQKVPVIKSQIKWVLVSSGLSPKPRQTYDDWIVCESYFAGVQKVQRLRESNCKSGGYQTQWSPRRHHGAIWHTDTKGKSYMYVMGGRAREFVELPEYRSFGGILDPRVEDPPDYVGNKLMMFTTQREASVVKSDVWRSSDGMIWTMVTPGCKQPQKDLLAQGNREQGRYGLSTTDCNQDADCYGSETCDRSFSPGKCVCSMWSPREQFTVASHGGYMYVVGGYASRLYSFVSNCGAYACGDTDASGYRYYMEDVWTSTDGLKWTMVTFQAGFGGRGGHQMLLVPSTNLPNAIPYLWVIGGMGGDNNGGPSVKYYSDVWTSSVEDQQPRTWTQHIIETPWSNRTGHSAVLQMPTTGNVNRRAVYIIGGYNNGKFLEDLWVLYLDDPNERWRQDFTMSEVFSTGGGSERRYANHTPAFYYISPYDPVQTLRKFVVPAKLSKFPKGKRPEIRPFITQRKLEVLNSVGIYTIYDLANASLYTVLKLRGFDFPGSTDPKIDFEDICDIKALAASVTIKCSPQPNFNLYDGQINAPQNIYSIFSGGIPTGPIINWHGVKNYDRYNPPSVDPDVIIKNWDGCSYNSLIDGVRPPFGPNVNGLGHVTQIKKVRDPLPELQELQCRWTPRQRAWMSAAFFDENIMVFGGKQSESKLLGDTWYRDGQLPTAFIDTKPPTNTPFPIFTFTADEQAYFEYRIWDPINYLELRAWTRVVHKTDIGWLDWRKNGPGNGFYTLYVRAVDAAGNRDERYVWNRNVYNWYYVSPTPWDIIAWAVSSFIGLCIIGYLEYRRRMKKAAMERYAMKRMRRKFKAMQRDIDGRAVDWRTLYMESKEMEEARAAKKKKSNKKSRDKKAEAREKEKQKRDKEKEKIKKKLKGTKDFKSKMAAKVAPGGSEPAAEDPKKKKKGKDRKGKDDDEGDLDDGNFGEEGGGVDEKKLRSKEKDKEKFEEEKGKKFKSYEKEGAGGGGAAGADKAQTANSELEEGAKQRKPNKRFKDYENAANDNSNENKKDA